jgi:hypothetical protein
MNNMVVHDRKQQFVLLYKKYVLIIILPTRLELF